MIASLPMYDRPETAGTIDRLWREIRARLPEGAPEVLTRDGSLWDHWDAPELILSQTCGYPYRARLKGHVQLVAMPDNRLPGVLPGHYNSVFVVRGDDRRGILFEFADALLAFNEPLSQSGWAAPQNHAAAQGFAFGRALHTGAHLSSACAVAEGRADIACIDAVSWRLIRRHEPFAARLRELERTDLTPAPPFITSMAQDPGVIRAALVGGIAALSSEEQDVIGLFGVTDLPEDDYLSVPNPAPPAAFAADA